MILSSRAGLVALFLVAALGSASCTANAAEPEPVRDHVTVADGELRGTDDGAVARFQGIPFAAPPVGPLRWAPPQDAAPWTGTRDATAPGPACAQAPSPATPTSSEDCLTLAVSTPSGSTEASRLPVLVWIHGGGFTSGAGSEYDPRDLVAEGPLVVVTINYRLGALGFLGLPGLDGSGAFGLQDQQAALRWVRDNVTAFGGDPGNVTIAGESAGADSVCSQLGSPGAVGFFHRAILQTGSCHADNVTDRILPGAGPAADTWKPRETVDGAGLALAGSLGCSDLDCLRALPADRFTAPGTTYWSPATGTDTLPRRPSEALAAGDVPDVPLLVGSGVDEGALFGVLFFGATPLDEAAFGGLLALAAGDRIAEATAAYPLAGRTPNRAWADVITEMRGYWTRFATTGDPNGEGETWPPFGPDGPLLTLSSAGSTTTTATEFAAAHRCDIWR